MPSGAAIGRSCVKGNYCGGWRKGRGRCKGGGGEKGMLRGEELAKETSEKSDERWTKWTTIGQVKTKHGTLHIGLPTP